MPTLELTVNCTASEYWVAVDQHDVLENNPQGSVTLPAGDHLLVWWMFGSAGDTISITGISGGQTVVTVPPTAIPDGGTRAADYQHFVL